MARRPASRSSTSETKRGTPSNEFMKRPGRNSDLMRRDAVSAEMRRGEELRSQFAQMRLDVTMRVGRRFESEGVGGELFGVFQADRTNEAANGGNNDRLQVSVG